jgi:Lrp/AsnC family transcriptional regulator, leucine-responsive regulatory protein
MNINQKNRKILNIIQNNGKISNGEISKELEIPTTTIFERIKKMEKEGVIKGYKAIIDPQKVELGLTSFVFIKTDGVNYDNQLVRNVQKIPFVLELHEVAGAYSYVAKVCAKNQQHLSEILREYFGKIKGIAQTNSHIVLNSILSDGHYPIDENEE